VGEKPAIMDWLCSAYTRSRLHGTVTAEGAPRNLHLGTFHVCQATPASWYYRLDWFLDLLRLDCGSVSPTLHTNKNQRYAGLTGLPGLVAHSEFVCLVSSFICRLRRDTLSILLKAF
jgi:hypothetical protein